eukprot:2177182-Amphidinium_carterae.1
MHNLRDDDMILLADVILALEAETLWWVLPTLERTPEVTSQLMTRHVAAVNRLSNHIRQFK